jgi:hypothetical protein
VAAAVVALVVLLREPAVPAVVEMVAVLVFLPITEA